MTVFLNVSDGGFCIVWTPYYINFPNCPLPYPVERSNTSLYRVHAGSEAFINSFLSDLTSSGWEKLVSLYKMMMMRWVKVGRERVRVHGDGLFNFPHGIT